MDPRAKPSKAQEPWWGHVKQGVQASFADEGVILQPTARRLTLEASRCTAETAHTLAGKLNFVNQTLFGKVGRAALSPIYDRASANSGNQTEITPGMRAALLATQSRFIPFTAARAATCVIYADADPLRPPERGLCGVH